jgi:GDP-L-fucose synthase
MKNRLNILITGGSGFAGKHLIQHFSKDHRVFAPGHKELDLLNEKAVDNFFKTHKIDVVIHTALVGGSRAEEAEESALSKNIRIFFNIIRNKKYFKKMINCGSGAEYDKRFPIVEVKEENFGKKIPVDEYGLSKFVFSEYIENAKEDIVSLRIFALFGPGEDYRYRFISNAICRNLFGLSITMRQDVYFDYVNIKDFVKVVDYFVHHKTKYKIYNFGTGKRINIKTIAQKINKIADHKSKIIIKKRGLNNEYTCSNQRLLKEIKGFKFMDFDTSLEELYDWYKENKNLIKKEAI